MTIDLSGAAPSSQLIQSTAEPATTSVQDQAPRPVATSSSNVDRTTFQSGPSSVQALVNTALAAPEIRQDKVDSARQSISNGTHTFDAGKVADAMIASNKWS
jgi:flagellar biosynthesis anti-sigma factor FlgM